MDLNQYLDRMNTKTIIIWILNIKIFYFDQFYLIFLELYIFTTFFLNFPEYFP